MVGVGSQLRRRSDGARFDALAVGRPARQPNGPIRLLLGNLGTGRRHWVLLDNYGMGYEACPAL